MDLGRRLRAPSRVRGARRLLRHARRGARAAAQVRGPRRAADRGGAAARAGPRSVPRGERGRPALCPAALYRAARAEGAARRPGPRTALLGMSPPRTTEPATAPVVWHDLECGSYLADLEL